ncbi:MAG: CHAT domain-containing protein [Verrucomicrobiaceae bacterium]
MRLIILHLLICLPLAAGPREEALALIGEAVEWVEAHPAVAAGFARQAFEVLEKADDPAAAELSACAAHAARAWRLAGEMEKAKAWFGKAIPLADPESGSLLRAELADLLMREGEPAEARRVLGQEPAHPSSFWHQTLAKLHLTCGQAAEAKREIGLALADLPKDSLANRAALLIDAAGIELRLGKSPAELIGEAEAILVGLDDPHPEMISALASVAAQDPERSPEEALTILQSAADHLKDDPVWRQSPARLSFAVSLADAAARCGRSDLVRSTLLPLIERDELPDDHPLLARALFLAAEAEGEVVFAKRSSEVAMRWLAGSETESSEVLLGIQRTVDPVSPLLIGPVDVDALLGTALASQNHALRKRLGGTVAAPGGQAVLFLIYYRGGEAHYGALVLRGEAVWVDLGPAGKIHDRLTATIETAERTLGEATGSTLSLTGRLTQLWKSVWEPLLPHLDLGQPLSIAPTGLLHFVPWATLRDRDGRYLCQTAEEVRILALTGKFPERTQGGGALFVGVDEAPGAQSGGVLFPFDEELAGLVGDLAPLPGVKDELGGLTGEAVMNPDEERLRNLLLENPPEVLHLAGHGFVAEGESAQGFRAGFLLGGAKDSLPRSFAGELVPEGEDNLLFAREIAALELSRTGLVVLSACRGGIGRSEVGGNWSSLRRAFIAAGAGQVLASQWRVRDDELPPFMKALYGGMRSGEPAHRVLWKLQRDWIEEKIPAAKDKPESLRAASAGAWVLEGTGF